MKFCTHCGKELKYEAVICTGCGCEVKNNNNLLKYNEIKTPLGILFAIFLGIIGLIIGIIMYPSGSEARKTFVKGWLITFVICILIFVLLLIYRYTTVVL